MFKPVNFEEGKIVEVAAANSTAFVAGSALKDDGNGLVVPCAAGDGVDVNYVAVDSVTTTVAGQKIRAIPTRGVRFLADCDAAPAQTDVGTYADLAGPGTVDPDASADDIFFIESIDLSGGAVGTSTRVFGYFNHANET